MRQSKLYNRTVLRYQHHDTISCARVVGFWYGRTGTNMTVLLVGRSIVPAQYSASKSSKRLMRDARRDPLPLAPRQRSAEFEIQFVDQPGWF
jgi:hypothetical protein